MKEIKARNTIDNTKWMEYPCKKQFSKTTKQSLYIQSQKMLTIILLLKQNTGVHSQKLQKYGTSKDGYFKRRDKEVSHILGEEYVSGGVGIITTVSDYAKLMVTLAG